MNVEAISSLANLGGVVVIAVLLVWRIDVRMSAVETVVRELCVLLAKAMDLQEE